MIKLKNILNELTSHSWEIPKQDKPMDVTKLLLKNSFPVSNGDHKAALKRAKTFEDGKMFVHVQYHTIQHKENKPLFVHQTQYYVTGHEVNVTQVYLEEYEDYESGSDKKKFIGRAIVPTDKLLKGLKRVTVLKKG